VAEWYLKLERLKQVVVCRELIWFSAKEGTLNHASLYNMGLFVV